MVDGSGWVRVERWVRLSPGFELPENKERRDFAGPAEPPSPSPVAAARTRAERTTERTRREDAQRRLEQVGLAGQLRLKRREGRMSYEATGFWKTWF